LRLYTDDGKRVLRKWLDVNKSLEDHELIPGSQILLTPLSLFLKVSLFKLVSNNN